MRTQSFSGCFFRRLKIYFEIDPTKMENPEIAMAPFVEKPKNVMHIGVMTPPPPIPATVAKAIKTPITSIPIVSLGSAGNTFFCTQLSSLQTLKG